MRKSVKKLARRAPVRMRRDAKAIRLSDLSVFRLEDRTVPTLFSNTTPIAIPASGTNGNANPYPSTIAVSGLTGHGAWQASRDCPPRRSASVLKKYAARLLTFDDAAAGPLTTGAITTGSYKPTNIDQGDPDTIPGAPTTPPTVSTTLTDFRGLNPNGTWELRVVDDAALDTGTMAGGWTLDITSKVNGPPVANNRMQLLARPRSARGCPDCRAHSSSGNPSEPIDYSRDIV